MASYVKVVFRLDVIAEKLGYSSDTVTSLQDYVQSNLQESVTTGTFIALSKEYAASLNDTSLNDAGVAETFEVQTTLIEYLVTVAPTTTPTVSPSSPTPVPTRGAETFVDFNASITLSGLPIPVMSATPSLLSMTERRRLTSKTDTASLLSYVVYDLLGLTPSSTVTAALAADGTGNYVTTFSISILAESLGYTAGSATALYSYCISVLTESVTSGSFISTIKSLAVDWGYSDFDSVSNAGSFSFSKNRTVYAYSNPPTVAPSTGRIYSYLVLLNFLYLH